MTGLVAASPVARPRHPVATRLRTMLTPATVHYVSMAVAFAWLVVCGRGQWFFFDEWDFLKLSSIDYFTPHLGHWSTVPMLVTAATRQLFGLGSYWPYLVPTLLIHLGIAHALWRVMRRLRVAPWIAVALAFVVALFGAGSENVLWAFQFGFLGAVLLGLVAVLLTDRMTRQNYRRRFLAVALVSVLSLLFSGTALPMLVAIGVVALRRVGLWRTALLLTPAVAVYGAWYVYAKLNPVYFMPPGIKPGGVDKFVIDVPAFAVRMIVGGLDGLTPVPFFGYLLFGVLVLYGAIFARRLFTASPAALGLAAAAVAFALVTAVSRIDFSADTSMSSRYIYLTTVLLVPLIGLLCTRLAAANRWVGIAIVAALGLTAVYGGYVMRVTGQAQAITEQATRDVFYATVALIGEPGRDVNISAYPDPAFAPSVTVGDIRAFVDAGLLTAGPYSERGWNIALSRLTLPDDAPATVTSPAEPAE
ncbi:hypothetical protein [Herbiconiux daphne]|uniref:Glycosyltransferase RgtA/B/C/D-like domain-containing protein n=1 Tax=Herbiconiux daphne TaxID=2970914 RepID=A0ABT2H4Q5_9MICO|nr:hypothetical protein [Herbiconiux daphne]MCS5734898.1 hypothetical protein [Herbiconiux daphne]